MFPSRPTLSQHHIEGERQGATIHSWVEDNFSFLFFSVVWKGGKEMSAGSATFVVRVRDSAGIQRVPLKSGGGTTFGELQLHVRRNVNQRQDWFEAFSKRQVPDFFP